MEALLVFLSAITVSYLTLTLIILLMAGKQTNKDGKSALTILTLGQVLAIATIVILFLNI